MLRWFQALMPKEERFFDLFARHSEAVVAGATALRAMMEGGEAIASNYQAVMDREHDADDATREVLIAVRRTFITPFDRSDIQDLTSSMDDAIDQMNKTAKIITLYEVRSFDPAMQKMGDIVPQVAKLMQEAMPLLSNIGKNSGRLHEITGKMIALEEISDQLHDEGRKQLFLKHRNGNAIDFIVGGEIYDHLEKVVDRFEDVANEISALVTDHL
jgi:predicted phosphate transport protein (TIGR00153 family)